ncbi:MAG TPA: response regulator [Burkholderiales bacterium]|nr:response regulator [Burkholderiales bacterium]
MDDRATIFIVDDDQSVCRSLARVLSLQGYGVRCFGSASDFLESACVDRPGCMLVDLCLPGMDGLELQRRVTELTYSIPVVFMSGHGDIPASVRAMKQGATDFLTKPFVEHRLLDAIAIAIEQDRRNRTEHREIERLRARVTRLTPREKQVFSEVVSGKLNKQIAATLGITEKTVKVHRQRVMEKTQARSVAELVRIADRLPHG